MKRVLATALVLTGAVLTASLFVCKTVTSYEEMADIRLGWPVPFLSVNLQRYSPLTFPQCLRVGSPWEDPMRVLWPALVLDVAIIAGVVLATAALLGCARREA